MIKKIFKITAGIIAALLTLIIAFYFIGKVYFYNIPVLMYHHVKKAEEYGSLTVSPQRFAEQMDFIKKFGYKVLTLEEFIKYKKTDKEYVNKNLILLTFDDGYKDNYTYAYNMLKARGIGGVFFVPVNKIGNKGRLTKKQILEMDDKGMIFGSHTLNETYLPNVSYGQMKKEIFKSKEKLEELLDEEVKSIAYCIGGYTKETLDLVVEEAGYEIGFTTNRGFEKDRKNDSIYQIRRIKVTNRDNNFKLWVKLTGLYNIFREIKEPN